MKLITYQFNNIEEIGVLVTSQVYPLCELGFFFSDMNALITTITPNELVSLQNKVSLLEEGKRESKSAPKGLPLSKVTLCSPIPSPLQDIICLGINYFEHAKESKPIIDQKPSEALKSPIYFSKRASTTIGSNTPINGHFDIIKELDYEVELAVIISKNAYKVSPQDVQNYIFGYTIMNDITAREFQKKYKQWYFAKSLDSFTVLGPSLTTADEIPFPVKLPIQSFVNGELRQNSNTDQLIFDISHIVSELSEGMTLKAGTIISTGTPSGVGMGFTPPKYLKKGDVVKCTIERLGSIENIIGD